MTRSEKYKIHLGLPTYAGNPWFRSRDSAEFACRKYHFSREEYGSSLLPAGFGQLWCHALDDEDCTHFAMLHDDIAAEPYWLDTLVDEMDRQGCNVLSAVVPIKIQNGVTSTAIQTGGDWDQHRRLTVKEVAALPNTFTASMAGFPGCPLLINTGCWVARIRHERGGEVFDWCDEFPGFQITTLIEKRIIDGKVRRCTRANPEDWDFGRWLYNRGLRVMATKIVNTIHRGAMNWDSTAIYGEQVDPDWVREQPKQTEHVTQSESETQSENVTQGNTSGENNQAAQLVGA